MQRSFAILLMQRYSLQFFSGFLRIRTNDCTGHKFSFVVHNTIGCRSQHCPKALIVFFCETLYAFKLLCPQESKNSGIFEKLTDKFDSLHNGDAIGCTKTIN